MMLIIAVLSLELANMKPIVHMPPFESNIPSTIFYGSIFSEFLHIARHTLKLEHFPHRDSKLQGWYCKEQVKVASINRF